MFLQKHASADKVRCEIFPHPHHMLLLQEMRQTWHRFPKGCGTLTDLGRELKIRFGSCDVGMQKRIFGGSAYGNHDAAGRGGTDHAFDGGSWAGGGGGGCANITAATAAKTPEEASAVYFYYDLCGGGFL